MGMLIRNLTHGKTKCYRHNPGFRFGSARVLHYVFRRLRLLRANEAKRDPCDLARRRKGPTVEHLDTHPAPERNERLAVIVDRCLESEAAYKLFDMLGAVSRLDMEDRLEYIELVKDSGLYTDEEIHAIERLIVSGTAGYFKDVIDQVREEQVRREIDQMLV